MKKKLLVGNFGSRNVGDEIILWSALQKYSEATVMTADTDFSRRFLEVESDDKIIFIKPFPTGIRSFVKFIFDGKSREIYRKLKIDQIIFPGGGLLAIKMKAYLVWGITVWWLRRYFPEAEIIFEHQGVDETNNPIKKLIISYIFKKENKISVRDKISRDFLQIMNIDSQEVGDRVEVWLKDSDLKKGERKNLVLINACRENHTKFKEICTPKNLPTGTSASFICFDPYDARYVPAKFHGKIIYPETISEVFKLFQKAKSCIGQRLHFLILANYFCGSDNTSILGEPYSQKVENFAGKYKIKSLLIKK